MFPWGSDPKDFEMASKHAWFRLPISNLKKNPTLQKVGQLRPSVFGLHDMCGLVKEWVADRHDPTDDFSIRKTDVSDRMIDPVGKHGTHAVAMNGGFNSPIITLASSHRGLHNPEVRQSDLGFRIVINHPA